MQRFCAKDHGSPKCPSGVAFKILNFEGPFEVASFEHFGLECPFNMAAIIVFTLKCPLEGDISHLECSKSNSTCSGRSDSLLRVLTSAL